MIIAVTIVRMMQMSIDQIVYVITVGHRLMPTTRAVNMTGVVGPALMVRRTIGWVLGRHF